VVHATPQAISCHWRPVWCRLSRSLRFNGGRSLPVSGGVGEAHWICIDQFTLSAPARKLIQALIKTVESCSLVCPLPIGIYLSVEINILLIG
jgi:hypothetical protein